MNLKDKTALVVDHGLFLPLALKLSESFEKVFYYTPWEKGFPLLEDCTVGSGFEERGLYRVDDPRTLSDCYVFPDIQHASMQVIRDFVWGSKWADQIEIDRLYFLDLLKKVGLSVPKFNVIEGLTELRKYLEKNPDKFIKISKYRGSMETWHFVDMEQSGQKLDELAFKFGSLQDRIPFLVFDPIETDLEIGYDGYCVDGQFPVFGLNGIEKKDQSYMAVLTDYDDFPEEIRKVNEKFAPILKEYGYANFWSTEIRVTKDDFFFIDPCCRCPSPAIEPQLELWGNLAEVIWAGAHGEMVDPEPTGNYVAQCIIEHTGDPHQWRTVKVDSQYEKWIKIQNCCLVDGRYCIRPNPNGYEFIGSVIGIGDTLEEAVMKLKEAFDEGLKGQDVSINLSALYDALVEGKKAEKEGVMELDSKLPKAEKVIQ